MQLISSDIQKAIKRLWIEWEDTYIIILYESPSKA